MEKIYHSNRTLIKICCIQSIEEAHLAIQYGAKYIGLVSEMPSGPGIISLEKIAEIAASLPKNVSSVLLTSQITAKEILEQYEICRTNAIQLVDEIELFQLRLLKKKLTDVMFIQAIHVNNEDSLIRARMIENFVDAILLDSGNPDGEIKMLGGTGKTHDWSISRKIRESINIPLFLAGGLNPDNVARAIRTVQPFTVDVCSGVRIDGKLNEARLALFSRMVETSQN